MLPKQVKTAAQKTIPLFDIVSSGFAIGIVMSLHTRSSLVRFGAELAGMRVTEQIDAIESLAIDSFKYLVVTRVVACIIALPVLTTIMNFAALIGGFTSEH